MFETPTYCKSNAIPTLIMSSHTKAENATTASPRYARNPITVWRVRPILTNHNVCVDVSKFPHLATGQDLTVQDPTASLLERGHVLGPQEIQRSALANPLEALRIVGSTGIIDVIFKCVLL